MKGGSRASWGLGVRTLRDGAADNAGAGAADNAAAVLRGGAHIT